MTANENRLIEEYFHKCSPLKDPQDSPVQPGNLSAENEDNKRSALTNATSIVKSLSTSRNCSAFKAASKWTVD